VTGGSSGVLNLVQGLPGELREEQMGMGPKTGLETSYSTYTRGSLRTRATYSVDPRLIQEAGTQTGLEDDTTKMQLKNGLNSQEFLTHGQGM